MIRSAAGMALAAGLLAACAGGAQPDAANSTSPTPAVSATASPSTSPSPSVTPTPSPSRPPVSSPGSSPPVVAGGLPQWLRDGVVTRLPTTRRVVALTFDGGSAAQGATAILAALSAARVHATFFLTGDFVRRYPLVVAAIVRGGHVIGNHTMTHPHTTALSTAALQREITDTAARIQAATGISPRPWFRFPYGEYDTRSLTAVHALGYGAIGWTVDTLGWEGKEAGTSSDVVGRVLRGLRPGEIVLMHLGANPDDGTTYDAVALATIIAKVRAAGYDFVSLAASGASGP